MPYFSELLVREGQLMTKAVILTETGESLHESEVAALPDTSWRPNYAIRSLCRELADDYENDLSKIRVASEAFNRQILPEELYCPVGMDLFESPVTAEDGHTYERKVISGWIESCKEKGREPRSPLTRERISLEGLVANRLLDDIIRDAIRQREESLDANTPDVIRGIGEKSVADILRAFNERVRGYFRSSQESMAQASAQSAESRRLSAEGEYEQGSAVHHEASATGARGCRETFEASAAVASDLVSTAVKPGLFSIKRPNGANASEIAASSQSRQSNTGSK